MKVRLVVVGDVPPGLAAGVVTRLPDPFEGTPPEESEVDLGPCYDRTRAQVDAACLLEALPRPSASQVLLALTGADLFLPALAYVFGLSPVGQRRGVVSWARLRPQEGEGREDTLLRRLCIEAVHELGHALGLVHCPVTECAMHRSLWPEAVDLKRPAYCPSCATQLAEATVDA